MESEKSSQLPPLVLFADTNRSADMFYLGGVRVPDPFLAWVHRGRSTAVVNALEFGRLRKESRFHFVQPLEKWSRKAREKYRREWPDASDVLACMADEKGWSGIRVPKDFPIGLARRLEAHGLQVEVLEGQVFVQRERKTEAEARWIAEGNRASARGLAVAERMLRESTIRGRRLFLGGKPLTSERVRQAIEIACLEMGATAADTIVAGGDQACDPHCGGTGPLRPGELIIVDIFPRVSATGYHGDMTRTFLKGAASDAQKALVGAVRDAQKAALRMIRAGIDGHSVHEAVCQSFLAAGYETRHGKDGSEGFFHGTGHGLGLEVHEPPRVSTVSQILPLHAVITVEPGLYYPGLGGCRIEDVVRLQPEGYELLSKYPYRWELP